MLCALEKLSRSLNSLDAAHHSPHVALPRTIGGCKPGGLEVPELRFNRFVAIVARFFGLAEARDIAFDPAEWRLMKARWNRAARDEPAHMIGPSRKGRQILPVVSAS